MRRITPAGAGLFAVVLLTSSPLAPCLAEGSGTRVPIASQLPRGGFATATDLATRASRSELLVEQRPIALPVVTRSQERAIALSDTGVWSALTPTGALPPARSEHSAIYDPVRHRMLVFGGFAYTDGGGSQYFNDLWELSLSASPTWTQLTPAGALPAPRWKHSAIYDPVNDRMIIFGGSSIDGQSFSDVWSLSLAGQPSWIEILPAGVSPGARRDHTAILDPVRHRMVVFGGAGGTNDVWELRLDADPAWSQRVVAGGSPDGRTSHSAVYDPVGDRMLMFDGWNTDRSVWSLQMSGEDTWTELSTSGAGGVERSAMYDPVMHRAIVFGGVGQLGNSYFNDVWHLTLSDSVTWTRLSLPNAPHARDGHSAIYDPVADRMIVFGGNYSESWYHGGHWYTYYLYMNDAPVMTWDRATTTVPRPQSQKALYLHPIAPNPLRSGAQVGWEMTRGQAIRLEVLDVQGRTIRQLKAGFQAAGRGEVAFDGRDDRGRPLAAGVYLMRLRTSNEHVVRRVVVLP